MTNEKMSSPMKNGKDDSAVRKYNAGDMKSIRKKHCSQTEENMSSPMKNAKDDSAFRKYNAGDMKSIRKKHCSQTEENMSIPEVKAEDGSAVRTYDTGDMKFDRNNKWTKKKDQQHEGRNSGIDAFRKEKEEKFPGRKPVSTEALKKFYYGPGMKKGPKLTGIGMSRRNKFVQKEKLVEEGRREAARAEMLLTEQSGCVEAAEGFSTMNLTQRDIVESSDITSKCKSFELKLDHFGPYKLKYFRDGRHLALAGKMGHLSNFNWVTKKLTTEINIMQQLYDVCYLQDHRTLAVAQNDWVSIYDEAGVELHAVKDFYNINYLDYMPYHFLCVALSSCKGMLHYLDVTLGQEVTNITTGNGRASGMCHNPYNGVICTSHVNGTVNMWTPNCKAAVASMLAHKAPVSAMAYDPSGRYLVTSSCRRELHIWDARNLGTQLHSLKTQQPARQISVSQRGLIALGFDRDVQIYRGIHGSVVEPYMKQSLGNLLSQVQFCPYEDVLGVTTRDTFISLIIPGAGEANFDAAEVNPYSSKSNRREALIKGLLAKVPAELITLDPYTVAQVDIPTLEEKLEAQRKLVYVNVPRINPKPKYRMKGKSGSAQTAKRKMIRKEMHKTRYLDKVKKDRIAAGLEEKKPSSNDKYKEKIYENVLDRFK